MDRDVLLATSITPDTELNGRISRCRESLASNNVDAVVITSRANFEYFSGWRGPSWSYTARPSFAILSANDFVLIVNPFEESDIVKKPRPFRSVAYDGFQHAAVEKIVEVIKDMDLGKSGVVAVDYCQDMFGRGSLELIDRLRDSALVQVISAEKIIWPVRKYKSQYEISLKKKAFAIMNASFDEAIAQAHAGMTKLELLRNIKCRLLMNGAESVDHILVHVYGNEPEDSEQDVRIKEGDYFWVDVFSTYRGYPADRCRIARCGEPRAEEYKCYEDVRWLTIDLCKSIRPGMQGRDIYHRFEKLCAENDIGPFYTSLSRIGHDSGMEVTEPNCSIASWSEDIIEPGMVIHLEPKLFKHGGVYQFEEVVYVRPDGVEFLSELSPERLPVIPVK